MLEHVIQDELIKPCEDGEITLSDNEEALKILGLILYAEVEDFSKEGFEHGGFSMAI